MSLLHSVCSRWFRSDPAKHRSARQPRRYRPVVELLELRLAPATTTINVTSTSDVPNYAPTVLPSGLAGNVTLRDALNAANNFGHQAASNSSIINLSAVTYTLNTVDNYWYGPDGL